MIQVGDAGGILEIGWHAYFQGIVRKIVRFFSFNSDVFYSSSLECVVKMFCAWNFESFVLSLVLLQIS